MEKTWADWIDEQNDISCYDTTHGDYVVIVDGQTSWMTTRDEWMRVMDMPARLSGDDDEREIDEYAAFCDEFARGTCYDAVIVPGQDYADASPGRGL